MNEPLHDRGERVAEYRRQFGIAADSLLAAIRTQVTDGGETVTHLLATVAANLGGLDQITARRPGSWEANQVQQFLSSTVGSDSEFLLQFRTRPIEVVECVELAMVDLGVDFLYDESFALVDATEMLAADEGDDTAWDRLDHAEALIDRVRTSAYATYRDAFESNIRDAARALTESRHLPIDVPVSVPAGRAEGPRRDDRIARRLGHHRVRAVGVRPGEDATTRLHGTPQRAHRRPG